MSEQVSPAAVTPPRREPGRPGVVTAAIVLWTVLGVLFGLTSLGFLLALVVPGAVDPGTGSGLLVAAVFVFAVLSGLTLWAARGLAGAVRRARRVLTVLGVVLAVAGLVQLTFLGVGGVYCVAFAAGALLLHVPAARGYFARESW